MRLIGKSVTVVPTAPAQPRNGDVLFAYRPGSKFYHPIHFPEPETVAMRATRRTQGEFILFSRERDPDQNYE